MVTSLSEDSQREPARTTAESLVYSHGFGNLHSSEAIPGALPSIHSPQRPPFGLYTEQITGSAFTEPRLLNRHSWMYRIRPSVQHPAFHRVGGGTFLGLTDTRFEMNRCRWAPLPDPPRGTDFITGIWTLGGTGDPAQRRGAAFHLYAANASMKDKVFSNSDAEMLITPVQGALLLRTEFGLLRAKPGEIALVPRGVRFRVELLDDTATGYVAENFGRPMVIPELGPLGANGMADPKDFRAPVAAYEDTESRVEVVVKFCGELWSAEYDHSPLDVVAWHGNHVPYVYDLYRFQTVGTLTYDHTDPSAYVILTSPTDTIGVPNIDFMAPSWWWFVAERSYRPQYFHRNISTELYGVIKPSPMEGALFGKPGSVTVQNMMTPHGQTPAQDRFTSEADLVPQRVDLGLLCVYETFNPIKYTAQALTSGRLDPDYEQQWQGYDRRFTGR